MNIVFLIYDELGLALLPGQLQPLLTALNQRHISSSCLCFVSIRYYFLPRWRREMRQRFSQTQLTFLPRLGSFFEKRLLAQQLSRLTKKFILHARSAVAASLALNARQRLQLNFPVIFDVRGATPEEWQYSHGYGKKNYPTIVQNLEIMEKQSYEQASALFFVTPTLKEHLEKKYGALNKPFRIIPCYVDVHLNDSTDAIKNVVSQLNKRLENRFVMLYSGSYATWQMVDQQFLLLKQLKSLGLNPFLLILSPHHEAFDTTARRLGITNNDYLVQSVPPHSAQSFYRLAHIGLLLREEHVINRVAFPVKFAEYLAMGVPVLISKTVVSCATFVEHHQVGWVVENNPDGIETNSLLRLQGEIRQLLNTEQLTPLRERCRQSAELLKFSQYENDYLELYQEIFHDKVGKP